MDNRDLTGHFWQVRQAQRDEWDRAMDLAWRTFLRFEAPDYTQEGIDSFREFILDPILFRMFRVGSYEMFLAIDRSGDIIGMLTLRNTTHISLLFVDESHHRMGVARSLVGYTLDYLRDEVGVRRMTVNASPYGLGFYHRIGFTDLGPERREKGIIYTPMEYRIY